MEATRGGCFLSAAKFGTVTVAIGSLYLLLSLSLSLYLSVTVNCFSKQGDNFSFVQFVEQSSCPAIAPESSAGVIAM